MFLWSFYFFTKKKSSLDLLETFNSIPLIRLHLCIIIEPWKGSAPSPLLFHRDTSLGASTLFFCRNKMEIISVWYTRNENEKIIYTFKQNQMKTVHSYALKLKQEQTLGKHPVLIKALCWLQRWLESPFCRGSGVWLHLSTLSFKLPSTCNCNGVCLPALVVASMLLFDPKRASCISKNGYKKYSFILGSRGYSQKNGWVVLLVMSQESGIGFSD